VGRTDPAACNAAPNTDKTFQLFALSAQAGSQVQVKGKYQA
jgi:hypothetical protein